MTLAPEQEAPATTSLISPTATAAPSWVPPAEVEPTRARDLRAFWARVSEVVGIRSTGWVVLAAGIALLIAGALTHWLELTAAGLLCVLLLLAAVLFTIGRPKYEVSLLVPEQHVTVGDDARGALLVANGGQTRSLPGRIDLPIGERQASMGIGSLAVSEAIREEFVIPTERRAVIEVGPAQSVQGDPFSLMGRDTMWTDKVEVFVHPKTVTLPGRQTGFVHDIEGHATQQLSNSDMSFHALREYVPGDDRRHVHWRSSARTGTLMVRQFEETRQSRLAVAVDLAEQAYASEAEFEDAVSVAASFVQQAFREENPVALVTNVEAMGGLTPVRIMNELSRIERVQRSHITEVVRLIRERESTASVIVLITGSRVRPQRLRRVAAQLGQDARVLALRMSHEASLRVETVSNVTVIQLADLADLPRAVRRASA